MSLRRGVIAVSCLAAVGCAEVTNAPVAGAGAEAAEPIAAAAIAAAVVAATPESLVVPEAATIVDSTEHPIEEPPVAPPAERALPSLSPAEIAPEASALAAAASPVTASEALDPVPVTEALEPEPSLAPSLVAAPTVETLDFSSLVTRLRETKAINLRTKLAVKNESDELLEQARVYHARTGETTLAELRRAYDSLFQELQSLLENADPPLARDIDRSRAAIWEILADPSKFNAI